MTRRQSLVVAIVVLIAIGRTQAQDNPQATSGSWRPTIVAQHGMVAAGHPLAAEAGMRILKAGGNAIDAAIATWAVQGEVEPGMTGLGADMFVLYYNAKTREVKFINGTGFAAQAATIDFYKSKGGIPDEGPLSIAVPAAVSGAAYAVKTYGTKPLADVLAPAIEIADVPGVRGAGRRHQKCAREDREIPVDDKDLFQGRQAAGDGRRDPQPRSGAHAARDRRAGS
jgi:gamma-glutamyltranspeptidase/glutathione hydrolase